MRPLITWKKCIDYIITMKIFDWIVVGGGIAGISLGEILTREGHSVALIEKKK